MRPHRRGECAATARSPEAYGCGAYTYSGPEIAYAFATDLTESVTIDVSGNTDDVDLFVLSSDACDGTDSVACSISPDGDPESVTFSATAGVVYMVVADGYEGATTEMSLSASCSGSWPGATDTAGEPSDTAGNQADTSPGETDTSPAPAGDGPGMLPPREGIGCGCATAGASGSGAALLFLLAGVPGVRRRP